MSWVIFKILLNLNSIFTLQTKFFLLLIPQNKFH